MKKIKTIALAAAMMAVGTTMAFAQEVHGHMDDGDGWWMYDGYHYGGMHQIWWLIWIVFLFIIFGIYQPVLRSSIKKNASLQILKKRFASGEITKEENMRNERKYWKKIN